MPGASSPDTWVLSLLWEGSEVWVGWSRGIWKPRHLGSLLLWEDGRPAGGVLCSPTLTFLSHRETLAQPAPLEGVGRLVSMASLAPVVPLAR